MLDRDEDGYTDDLGEMDGVDENAPFVTPSSPDYPLRGGRPDPTDITLLFEIGIEEGLALPIMARAESLGLKPTEYMRRIVLAHAGVDILPAAEQDAPPAEDTPDAA